MSLQVKSSKSVDTIRGHSTALGLPGSTRVHPRHFTGTPPLHHLQQIGLDGVELGWRLGEMVHLRDTWSTTRHNGRCTPMDLHRVQVFQVTLEGAAGDPQATGDLPLGEALRKQGTELLVVDLCCHWPSILKA
jgi:hypothetical protein